MFTISHPCLQPLILQRRKPVIREIIAMTHPRTMRCIVTMAPEPSPALVRYDPIDRGRQAL